MGTDELRANFLIESLFVPGRVVLTYSHYDRMIVGGAVPIGAPLGLETIKPAGTTNLLDRRELIAVNIGGPGTVSVGEEGFALGPRDMVYVGMGNIDVRFGSHDPAQPAKYYLLSAPAHAVHPTRLLRIETAKRLDLAAGRPGKIVNIASLLSVQGGIRVAAYAASKHGVAGLTKAFANEWAAHGINVNAIAPGYIETSNTEALRADPVRSRAILDRIPAGRWGAAADIGGMATFLLSRAADYVHGTIIPVDGGWLAR
ncbi:MAG: SDR family oxidoreductase [Devosia sp.]|nr:SDR family oxidoreductase [Devosia sp.]